MASSGEFTPFWAKRSRAISMIRCLFRRASDRKFFVPVSCSHLSNLRDIDKRIESPHYNRRRCPVGDNETSHTENRENVMKIGIIGAGQIGSTLASRFISVGHTVKIANSRGPESLTKLADKLGAQATGADGAVHGVDLVVVTVPQKSVLQFPESLFRDMPADTVVVDTGNYYPAMRDGIIAELEEGMTESLWVSEKLGRPVVKAFNNIGAASLAANGTHAGSPHRIALPVSGDNASDKEAVMDLIDQIGFDPIDAGMLEESWRQQPGTPVYCTDYDADGVDIALARADRWRAPIQRDLMLEKLATLPQGATHDDIVQLFRSLV